MSALIQRAPHHVGPVIRVVGPDNPVVPVHSVAGPVIPVEVPVHSVVGPIIPVAVPLRSAVGPVIPVVVPIIPGVMPVRSVAGPVIPVVVQVIPVFLPVQGGSSEDGGITTHVGIKEIAGKSRSIKKKIKLPTQVVLDAEGLLRTDFPFDQISARQKLRTLTHNTLFPVHPKKKKWKIELPVRNPQSR